MSIRLELQRIILILYIEFAESEMNHTFPSNIKSITAYLVIYCLQIEYEYRTPKIFVNIESAQSLPAYRIDDIRLNNFKSLNFGCYIEFLNKKDELSSQSNCK